MNATYTPWQTQLASLMAGALLGLIGSQILLAVIKLFS